MSKIILVAGGTGLIGKELCALLKANNFTVRVLSRQKSNYEKGIYHWDPINKTIDKTALVGVNTLINLAGENVAGKRWTTKRKEQIINSRVVPAEFLHSFKSEMPELQQYISASGINAYGFVAKENIVESEKYGSDFLSQVVQKWEAAADIFNDCSRVCKLRIGVVFSRNGGALEKLATPVKLFIGSPIGSGNQIVPWIDSADLCRIFLHVIKNSLEGTFNSIAGNQTNKELTKAIAKTLNRPLFAPRVPSFLMRLIMGEMSDIVLQGVHASNQKLLNSGFVFNESLEESLKKNLLG